MESLLKEYRDTIAKINDEMQKPEEDQKKAYLECLLKQRDDWLALLMAEHEQAKREHAERERAERERAERERAVRENAERERAERERTVREIFHRLDELYREPEEKRNVKLIKLYERELENIGNPTQEGSSFHDAKKLLPGDPPALRLSLEQMREYLEKENGKIPVQPFYLNMIQTSESHLASYLAPGNSLVAVRMTCLLNADWSMLYSELDTSLNVVSMFRFVFDSFQMTGSHLSYKLLLNLSEGGSSSRALEAKCRPDMLILAEECTLLVGEDKRDGNLVGAIQDLKNKLYGLNPLHYGNVPYALAYAAAGSKIQFFRLSTNGGKQMEEIYETLDLRFLFDRIRAIFVIAKLYQLLRLMAQELPRLHRRHALGTEIQRDDTSVCFFASFVRKRIRDFSTFCSKYGCSLTVLEHAYAAAGRAATSSSPPFLVTAKAGPKVKSSGCYEVQLSPLGFHPPILLETDIRAIARACCRALEVLHREGLVHRDVREPNVVCLDGQHWMLIDLEHAGVAGVKAPEGVKLAGWVGDTLDESGCFTEYSDLYMLGLMLSDFLLRVSTKGSQDFVDALKQKKLTAEAAIRHPWLAASS